MFVKDEMLMVDSIYSVSNFMQSFKVQLILVMEFAI